MPTPVDSHRLGGGGGGHHHRRRHRRGRRDNSLSRQLSSSASSSSSSSSSSSLSSSPSSSSSSSSSSSNNRHIFNDEFNHYNNNHYYNNDKIIKQFEQLQDDSGINIGHITVLHNGNVLLLSGFKGYKENSTASYRPSDEIWIYDQIVEKWVKKICQTETDDPNDMPLERCSACACILNENHLYMFGGYSEGGGNLNSLYRLDLLKFKWKQLKPVGGGGREPLPCDKNVCWEYDGKFFLFGGYGPVPRIWREDFQFQFIFDALSHWHYVRGWNNQLVYYDPGENQWKWPKQYGTIPSARAACAACKVDEHKIYLFGGRMNQERMNDMYMLNLKTMTWTQLQPNDPDNNNNNDGIVGRSWHTLTTLPDQRHIVLYGGFSNDNQPLNDCWIYDTIMNKWKEIPLPFNRPRYWHSATLSPSFGEILVLGGAKEELNGLSRPKHNHIFAKDMFEIQFQPKSLFRSCLNTISKNISINEKLFQLLPNTLMEIILKRCLNIELYRKKFLKNQTHRQQQQQSNNATNSIMFQSSGPDDDDDGTTSKYVEIDRLDDEMDSEADETSTSSSSTSDDDEESSSDLE